MTFSIARRHLLLAGLSLPWTASAARAATELPLTPQCDGALQSTPRQTEGPFYTPGTPVKRDFRADGRPGAHMVVMGYVVTRDCRPVADAVVDLWHADGKGAYDNNGFDLRGHQRTDGAGRYLFETIRPGRYPGRTPHFHVKVQRPGGPLLTTQLYFPGEPQNQRDFLFDQRLLLVLAENDGLPTCRFDFVVA
jgi:protocatechuate 3,4-dioxygenase beta subunit